MPGQNSVRPEFRGLSASAQSHRRPPKLRRLVCELSSTEDTSQASRRRRSGAELELRASRSLGTLLCKSLNLRAEEF